uniref:Uncharacterized protein n=1 Tax=Ditylum brightwellii TaxID=49249 RepID=A0A6V2AEG2_9STRA
MFAKCPEKGIHAGSLQKLDSSASVSGLTVFFPAPHASNNAQGEGLPDLDLSDVINIKGYPLSSVLITIVASSAFISLTMEGNESVIAVSSFSVSSARGT